MSKVLVLNASYEPLNITSWRRAVVLLLKGKAEPLEDNGRYLFADFPFPTVIRLRQYVRVPYKEIPLTRRNLLERDRHTCQYCNYRGEQLTLDHVIPRSHIHITVADPSASSLRSMKSGWGDVPREVDDEPNKEDGRKDEEDEEGAAAVIPLCVIP
jgi:5-methylcytosine-specific restriction endonuclease McrA